MFSEQDRLICIFGYETNGGTNSIFWTDPLIFWRESGQGAKMLDEDFEEWKGTKRGFTKEEVLTGKWLKVGEHGRSFIVQFYPDGLLTEWGLFNPSTNWKGSWELIGQVLRMKVDKYELDIIASRNSNIHSGIELLTDNYQPNTYFKVFNI